MIKTKQKAFLEKLLFQPLAPSIPLHSNSNHPHNFNNTLTESATAESSESYTTVAIATMQQALPLAPGYKMLFRERSGQDVTR